MNLARIRNLRGLSQQALADMIGKDKATISRAEKLFGGTTIKIYMLCAEALGVTIYDLFSEQRDEAEREIVTAYRNARPEVRELLVRMVKQAEIQPASFPQSDG